MGKIFNFGVEHARYLIKLFNSSMVVRYFLLFVVLGKIKFVFFFHLLFNARRFLEMEDFCCHSDCEKGEREMGKTESLARKMNFHVEK